MTHEELIVESSGAHIRVNAADWLRAAQSLHADGFTYFSFLSGIDWLVNPDLDGQKHYDADRSPATEFETINDTAGRLAGGVSRFSVFGAVRNVAGNQERLVYADMPESLTVESWTSVYPGADWHEREAWEMYGFDFAGHPGLRHIYLPDEFEGHPLRKDFMLAARVVRPWPGLVDMEEIPKKPEGSE